MHMQETTHNNANGTTVSEAAPDNRVVVCTHPGPRLALPHPHGPNSNALGYKTPPKQFVCTECYLTFVIINQPNGYSGQH